MINRASTVQLQLEENQARGRQGQDDMPPGLTWDARIVEDDSCSHPRYDWMLAISGWAASATDLFFCLNIGRVMDLAMSAYFIIAFSAVFGIKSRRLPPCYLSAWKEIPFAPSQYPSESSRSFAARYNSAHLYLSKNRSAVTWREASIPQWKGWL
ncbi:hypothetical protein BT63DRAFT_449123 [Microthyrium microscopicum]|uniref:Uncharacterized protein n=1 Tax=Microthyrium microscopicum TaxID=703497 RepID=A0A6A6UPB9_9PEZI|nr:hypothetical protein BT63DRAFT_449123 [Microthyrium microscopicum]